MSVEINTFNQILELPSETVLELVETVSLAAVMSPLLALSPKDKMSAALTMVGFAHSMLEQCGCEIEMKISNNLWTHPLEYKTGGEPHKVD